MRLSRFACLYLTAYLCDYYDLPVDSVDDVAPAFTPDYRYARLTIKKTGIMFNVAIPRAMIDDAVIAAKEWLINAECGSQLRH